MLRKKGLKEWSASEVQDVLNIFKLYDKSQDGLIDEGELKHLTDDLMIPMTR